jgi:hypothetical protein
MDKHYSLFGQSIKNVEKAFDDIVTFYISFLVTDAATK